jgi:hypothetical protein
MDSVQYNIWLVDLGHGHKVTIFTEILRITQYRIQKKALSWVGKPRILHFLYPEDQF